MKRGIPDQGDNRLKRFKSNSADLCAIISKLYDAKNAILSVNYHDDIQQLLSYIHSPQTLEAAFDQMPHACLKVAAHMAPTHPEYLKALLNNEHILPKINVHETIKENSGSVLELAFEQMIMLNVGGHVSTLCYLLEKIPLSTILLGTSSEQKEELLSRIFVAILPPEHPRLMVVLLEQEMFRDFIKSKISRALELETDCKHLYRLTYACNPHSPRLLECILLEDKALARTKQIIEQTPEYNWLYQCILNGVQCAKKGRMEVLNKIFLYIDQSPFNTKLHTLQNIDPKTLFIDLLMISKQNLELQEKIHTYLIAQDVQIDALEKEMVEVEWKNAIDNVDVIEVTKLIERNDCPSHLPVISWTLEKARTLLDFYSETDVCEKNLEIFSLLVRKNINLEALDLGLTALFHAIETDIQYHTHFTLFLLENAPVNVNAQCTYDDHAFSQRMNMTGFLIPGGASSPFPAAMTPLHYCFYVKKIEESFYDGNLNRKLNIKLNALVQTLLCYQCDIDLQDETGLSIREAMNTQPMDEIAPTQLSYLMQFLNRQPESKESLAEFLKTKGSLIKGWMAELRDNYETFADVVNLLSRQKNHPEEEGIHPGLPVETIAQIWDLAFCPAYKTRAKLEKNIATFIECKNNAKQETNDSNVIKHSL